MKIILLSALTFSALLAQDGAMVSGTVLDAATSHGLPDVQINLTSDQPAYETSTDAAGRFRISGVKPGQYAAAFDRPGYMWASIGSRNGTERPIRVEAGADVTALVVRMAGYATLEGHVLDQDGNPVAQAEVNLGGQLARTDAEGHYKFDEITPRKYDLSARPPRLKSAIQKGERIEAVRTWYPSLTQNDRRR